MSLCRGAFLVAGTADGAVFTCRLRFHDRGIEPGISTDSRSVSLLPIRAHQSRLYPFLHEPCPLSLDRAIRPTRKKKELDEVMYMLIGHLRELRCYGDRYIHQLESTSAKKTAQLGRKIAAQRTQYEDSIGQLERHLADLAQSQSALVKEKEHQHSNTATALEVSLSARLKSLERDLVDTQDELVDEKCRTSEDRTRLEQEHQSALNAKRTAFDTQISGLEEEMLQLQRDRSDLSGYYDQLLDSKTRKMEQDITTTHVTSNLQMASETREIKSLRHEHETLEQVHSSLTGQLRTLRNQLIELRDQQMSRNADRLRAKEALERVHEEISGRNSVISSKDIEITDLNRSSRELRKLKEVLDLRIAELRQQVAPRDDAIAELQGQLAEIDTEMAGEMSEQRVIGLRIGELALRSQSLMREIAGQNEQFAQSSRELNSLLRGLGGVVSEEVPKARIRALREFYQCSIHGGKITTQAPKFFRTSEGGTAKGGVRPASGTSFRPSSGYGNHRDNMHVRQREYLERSVSTLHRSLHRRREQLDHTREKAKSQNAELLVFANTLRRQNKQLLQRLRAARARLVEKKLEIEGNGNAPVTMSRSVSRALSRMDDSLRRDSLGTPSHKQKSQKK
eukprot:gnl/Dysnectes_brevis/8448_a15016_172.p1 GENE.gnl/Dysnectes_brevis/8448_a15016_172~~gnl/Dysnectes_brevis/8448_a15016_172.p1  ORF type:complete len:623 (-),score=212.55 gnl/Dysnectes_brevis/8448_a15016_172:44-1912(-)